MHQNFSWLNIAGCLLDVSVLAYQNMGLRNDQGMQPDPLQRELAVPMQIVWSLHGKECGNTAYLAPQIFDSMVGAMQRPSQILDIVCCLEEALRACCDLLQEIRFHNILCTQYGSTVWS